MSKNSAKDPAKQSEPARERKLQRDPVTGRLSGGNPGNSGGKKGRSGRKPDWYVAWLTRQLVHNKSLRRSIRAILRNPDHPQFRALKKDLEDRVLGKATETVNLNAKLTLEQLVGRSFKEGDE